MNIEEDFAVAAACFCIANTVTVLDEDEDRDECSFFVCVSNFLRDKTSRGVPCDSTLSKIAATLHQVSSTFETLEISRRKSH